MSLIDLLRKAGTTNLLEESRRFLDTPYDPAGLQRLTGVAPTLRYGDVLKEGLGLLPGTGDAVSAMDAYKAANQGNWGEAAVSLAGLIPFMGSLRVVGKKALGAIPGVEPDMAASMHTKYKDEGGVPQEALQAAIDRRAAMNAQPKTFDKPFSEMSDAEIEAIGKKHGVDFTINPMQSVVDPGTGRSWDIPGGLDGKFSYTDLHRLKAQAYDPNDFSKDFHTALQRKILDAVTPTESQIKDPREMFSRIGFGQMSPGTPLLQNQFLIHKMRPRTMEDLDKLAGYANNKAPTDLDKAEISSAANAIADDYNLGAAATGGMGLRSSASPGWLAATASGMKLAPEFYNKKPSESWQQLAERVGNVTPGLGAKTGSFGVVWQDPSKAATSAIDRHMVREFRDELEQHPEEFQRLSTTQPNLWNKQIEDYRLAKKAGDKLPQTGIPEDAKKVRNYAQLKNQPGYSDWADQRAETDITNRSGGLYRLKSGELNPDMPEHLRNLPFEPKSWWSFGPTYERALGINAKRAGESGLSLFGEQWRVWDPIRGQLEPHEVMYPGLHNLPQLSDPEIMRAYEAQKKAGFASSQGNTKPYNWKDGFVFSLPAMFAIGAARRKEKEDRGPGSS